MFHIGEYYVGQYIVLFMSIYMYISSYLIAKGKYYEFLPRLVSVEIEKNEVLRKLHVRHIFIDGTIALLYYFSLIFLDKGSYTRAVVSIVTAIFFVIHYIIIFIGSKRYR